MALPDGRHRDAPRGVALSQVRVRFPRAALALAAWRARAPDLLTPHAGVCRRHSNRWEVAVQNNGKTVYIGAYETEEEAAATYDRERIKIGPPKSKHASRPKLNFAHVEWADTLHPHGLQDKGNDKRKGNANRDYGRPYIGISKRYNGRWEIEVTANKKRRRIFVLYNTVHLTKL